LDEEYQDRAYIKKLCGLAEDEVLNQRVLERNLDMIVEVIENLRFELNYEDGPFGEGAEADIIEWYYVLAILIFETGSAFPDKVKDAILSNKIVWFEETVEEVKLMDYFRQRVRDYIPGTPLGEEISRLRHKMNEDFNTFKKMIDDIFSFWKFLLKV